MENTTLIQRLTTPLGEHGIYNPFSFGGGGGRISGQVLRLLAPVFNFDYMGAAEYECGAVPEALDKIRQHAVSGNLSLSTLAIKPAAIKASSYDKMGRTPRRDDEFTVYVVGAKSHMSEISSRIKLIATDEDHCMRDSKTKHEGLSLRDSTLLPSAIRFTPDRKQSVTGWLELNNGFFFSIDRTMTERFAALFGLSI